MTFFSRAALVSLLCGGAALAVSGSPVETTRKLASDYETQFPLSCYFNGNAGRECVGTDPEVATKVITYILPSAMDGVVVNGPSMVIFFPHDDLGDDGTNTAYGAVTTTYYNENCASKLISSDQAKFPATPDTYVTTTALAMSPALNTLLTLPVLTAIVFPLTTLVDLPSTVNTITPGTPTPNVHAIKFCTRLGLESLAGDELGYRELDMAIDFTQDDASSVTFIANDNDLTDGEFNLGDYSIEAVVCADTPSSLGVTSTDPLVQGETIAICLVPMRDPDGAGTGTAVRTTEIILEEITDFQMASSWVITPPTTTATGLTQSVYVDSVLQTNSEVADPNGNACALGVGAQTGTPPPVVYNTEFHGCRFETTLLSAIYEQNAVDDSGSAVDITITASGTAKILFSDGTRRVLQFNSGDSAALGANPVNFGIKSTGAAVAVQDDGCFLDWIPILGGFLCDFMRMIMRAINGGMDFFRGI